MKKIILTQGFIAIVDDEDYDILNQYNWQVQIRKWGNYAIRCGIGKEPKTVRMHRQIMNSLAGKEIDHINGDGLDNRKANLRMATHSQNLMNSRVNYGSSKYKGVHWCVRSQRWLVRIVIKGKRKYAGRFKTEREAGKQYNNLAIKHYGEYARLNLL